jgi:hypothetical protein
LQGSVAARAKTSSTNRIERIAFEFLDAGDALAKFFAVALNDALTFHDTCNRAAARAALSANGRMPAVFARRNFVVRDQQGNEYVFLLAAGICGHSRGDSRDDFEEVAAIH